MTEGPKIADLDLPSLPLIYYPDPRLTEACTPVEDPEGTLAAFAGLEGKVELDELGTEFKYETRGETTFCRATQTWRVKYQTLTVDPEQVT